MASLCKVELSSAVLASGDSLAGVLSWILLVFLLQYASFILLISLNLCSVVAHVCVSTKASIELHLPWTFHLVAEPHSWCKLCQHRWWASSFPPLDFLVRNQGWNAIFIEFWSDFCCALVFAGKIVLEALILTSAVVCSLTGYTFWASKKGKDFSYLGPILFTSLFVLFLTGFIQVRCLTFFVFGLPWI